MHNQASGNIFTKQHKTADSHLQTSFFILPDFVLKLLKNKQYQCKHYNITDHSNITNQCNITNLYNINSNKNSNKSNCYYTDY